jgi:uncharacterized membrane protein
VVDPYVLASDVTEAVVSFALPALAWAFLYLVAWEDPEVARDSGFGRRTFWLLVPVGFLATLGTIPFFVWDSDVLAINLAGGLVPILLSLFFLHRLLGRSGRALASFLVVLGAETAGLFALVVVGPAGIEGTVAVLVAIVVASALVALAAGGGARAGRTAAPAGFAGMFVLANAALATTFLTTSPEPGIGIVSVFPYYLLGPMAVGFVAVPLTVRWIGGDGRASLPVAYATATLGVLVGADVLRQPPLYGSGGPSLLSIGGAGLLDLLFLSGVLAAGSAYLLYRYAGPRRRAWAPPLPGAEGSPASPSNLLYRSQLLAAQGESARAVRKAADAAWAATEQARRLHRAPPAPRDRPWEGLPVAPWIAADQQNLEAMAARGTDDRWDAQRAWVTANGILGAAEEATRDCYPSLLRRSAAFGIDLGITLVPALLVWYLVILAVPGSTANLIDTVAFNTVVLGYVAYAFLYVALAEVFTGTTLGKRLLGLQVTDRAVHTPGLFSVLVRNIPKLVPLTILAVAAAVELAILVDGPLPGSISSGSSAVVQATQLLSVGGLILIGFAMCGAISWLAIANSREHQRLGDYVAGTWVIVADPGAHWAPPPLPPPGPGGGPPVRAA